MDVQQLQEASHDFLSIRLRDKEDLELPSEAEELASMLQRESVSGHESEDEAIARSI